jgi:mannonate dehydratase
VAESTPQVDAIGALQILGRRALGDHGDKGGNVTRSENDPLHQGTGASTVDTSRRALLRYASLGGAAAVADLLPVSGQAGEQHGDPAERRAKGMPAPKIVDVVAIPVPGNQGIDASNMLVKVVTDQDGLYGYGDASLCFRSKPVRVMIDEYFKPILVGKPADRIEQIWRLLYLRSYYKNDHIQNTAIGGICDALWDIKGRQRGVPVYELVGGKCREAAEIYMHAFFPGGEAPAPRGDRLDPQYVVDNSQMLVSRGVRNIQVDIFRNEAKVEGLHGGPAFDRTLEMEKCYRAFAAFRKAMPSGVRLGCDVHSMLDPVSAVEFCIRAEQYGPWYWMEDVVPPEEQSFFRTLRGKTNIPLAIGELYNNPAEWRELFEQRSIDYTRIHVAHIGGFTAARRVASVAEHFQVRTGWHGSPDQTPVGHMARLTLDLTSANFGFHEHFTLDERERELFPGAIEIKNGFAWGNDRPGWGIEVDEAAIAKLPQAKEGGFELHLTDGALIVGIG